MTLKRSPRPPAPRPCESCPYRTDVPSGIWAREEYEKLPAYDRETPYQPAGVFLCHQQDGRMCAGWAGCHDMYASLGLRLAVSAGALSDADYSATLAYRSPVPLFKSGTEAAAHGLRELDTPGAGAQRVMRKIQRRQS